MFVDASRASTARGSRRRRSSCGRASRRRTASTSSRRASRAAPSSARGSAISSCTAATSAPWAEALLYVAARAQLVDEVIRPALERGATVICDRYVDSSVAYQGVGRELGLERVLDLNLAAVGGLLPDSHVPARARSERGAVAHPAALRPARARRRRLPRACRRGLSRARRALPRADRRPRRDAARRRARRGGVWSPSRPYLSSPRRSGS